MLFTMPHRSSTGLWSQGLRIFHRGNNTLSRLTGHGHGRVIYLRQAGDRWRDAINRCRREFGDNACALSEEEHGE